MSDELRKGLEDWFEKIRPTIPEGVAWHVSPNELITFIEAEKRAAVATFAEELGNTEAPKFSRNNPFDDSPVRIRDIFGDEIDAAVKRRTGD